MENIEFLFSTGAFGFDVHAFEQIGIALRIEDNDDLVFDTMNVLGYVHLREPGFSDASRAQHQRVTHPFAQRKADLCFIWLDPMQQWRASYRR
jgi:hypothetical protein